MSAIYYIYNVTFMMSFGIRDLYCIVFINKVTKYFFRMTEGLIKYVSDLVTYSNEQFWPSDLVNQSPKVSE